MQTMGMVVEKVIVVWFTLFKVIGHCLAPAADKFPDSQFQNGYAMRILTHHSRPDDGQTTPGRSRVVIFLSETFIAKTVHNKT